MMLGYPNAQHRVMVLRNELSEGDYDKRFFCLIPAHDST